MRKYVYGAKVNLLSAYQYRFNTISNILIWNLGLFITFIFWMVAYKENNIIGGYSRSQMLTFIILVKVLGSFTFHFICVEMGQLIKNGGLNTHLLLPQNLFIHLYSKTFGTKVLDLFASITLLILFIPIISMYTQISIDVNNLVLFLIALIIGSIISYLLGILIGIMAFFTKEIFSIIWIMMVIINFFSGQLIPLDFFPSKYSKVVELLPFSSFGYFPTKVFIGNISHVEIIYRLKIYLIWILILSIVIYGIWRKGIKKYEAIGV